MERTTVLLCITFALIVLTRLALLFYRLFIIPTIGQTRRLQHRVEQTITPDELAVQLQAFGEALIARFSQDLSTGLQRANINYTNLIHTSLNARPQLNQAQLQHIIDQAQLLAIPQLREMILAAIPAPVVPTVQLDPEAFRLLLREHQRHEPEPVQHRDGRPEPGDLARRIQALAPLAQHDLPYPDPLDRNPEEILEDAVTERYTNPGMALTDIFHRGFHTEQVQHASGRIFWKATVNIPAEANFPAIHYELEPHINIKALKATLREMVHDMY